MMRLLVEVAAVSTTVGQGGKSWTRKLPNHDRAVCLSSATHQSLIAVSRLANSMVNNGCGP